MAEVFKFGGASLSDAQGIQNVAEIIKNNRPEALVVVVSAFAQVTNELEKLFEYYRSAEVEQALQQLEHIKNMHFNYLHALFPTSEAIYDEISNVFVEIEWLLEDEPNLDLDYAYDQIVSIGEILSSKIIAAYLQKDLALSWIDARDYIQTDNNYKEAQVDWQKTELLIQQKLPQLLKTQILITQGFIGNTTENYTTTLGRDGSDYSAAIFAACLNAERVTIWKDVPGVLNADPKWFNETALIPQLSYKDAIELTYYGANVIHPKTIKPLQNKNIQLQVKSFINPHDSGTIISNEDVHLPMPSFIFKVNQVLISILPKDFSFILEENLSTIFILLHKYKVKVNTMQNSALSFSISVDDQARIPQLIEELSAHFKVRYNKGLELVTIRHYNTQTIDRVLVNKEMILEVRSRYTCQMVLKDLSA